MADDTKKPGGEDEFEDSGLGNLPPLSDFDSQSGIGSESGKQHEFDSGGGDSLPPLSDSDSGSSDPFGAKHDMDTPEPTRVSGKGFQDAAADSDFSPETPDVGPGPDSNVDTPMFDSAFGGDDSGFDTGMSTPAPTQAMETPMFGDSGARGGDQGGDFGFDEGAFGNQGTPAPDFSPDTDVRRPSGGAFGGGAPPMAPPPPAEQPGRGGGGIVGVLIAALIALIVGVAIAPFISPHLGFLPNPLAGQVQQLEQEVTMLRRQIDEQVAIGVDTPITPEERDALQSEIANLSNERNQLASQVETLSQEVAERQEDLAFVEQDLADRSEEYALLEESFEDLQNQTAIVQARQRGLSSEVDRLTNLVGDLEDANARRAATKDALEHNLDRLLVQIRDSLPLTPSRYAHDQRVADVEMLQERVANANWVTPDLIQDYTSIYLRELEIADQEVYFFARMPVTDRLGYRTQKWAEALMLGNRAVYFRTLDGRNIGIYSNTGTVESPNWAVRENVSRDLQQGIEARIFEARVPGFEDQLQQLAQREVGQEEGTAWQRAFGSL